MATEVCTLTQVIFYHAKQGLSKLKSLLQTLIYLRLAT